MVNKLTNSAVPLHRVELCSTLLQNESHFGHHHDIVINGASTVPDISASHGDDLNPIHRVGGVNRVLGVKDAELLHVDHDSTVNVQLSTGVLTGDPLIDLHITDTVTKVAEPFGLKALSTVATMDLLRPLSNL